MNIDDTKTKIVQLLNLAKGTSNINEATTAFAQAQRLMDRYRISEVELRIATDKPNVLPELIIKSIYACGSVITWESFLCGNIAKINGCKMWIETKESVNVFNVAGTETNIELVNYLFNSVVSQIKNLAEIARKNKIGNGKSWYNSFKLGAVNTVIERLAEVQKETFQTASSSAMVLVTNDLKAVELFVARKVNLVTKHSKFRKIDHGMEAGKEAGKRVNISPGLGNNNSIKKLN